MSSPVPARPASTVLLLRDGRRGLEVFMVVRHHQIDFASGALVFPGGRVEASDLVLAGGDAHGAFRIAAIRETWEECGVLLAAPGAAPAAEGDFAAMLAARGLQPDQDALAHFAHWITPVAVPKRFDTHFFLAAAPADQDAVHDGGEAVDSVWIRPLDALAEAEAGTKKIVFPTRMNLNKLARSTSVAEAFAAARARPVVTVQPIQRDAPEGRYLRIPIEADYGGEEFLAGDPPSM
ncbi:NUDIX hydrolase [Neoroseomonas oryzicola]|uniref:NUDIX domain-containing protein n=1 Tax=Neoroseomonas oryzicola TaxID=535904 RepID=A0A9X9WBW9_9PROT|nr:NUDIX domain-containing protein [Neoroseomonas oryzicola]MBR0657829.1 NUDIX domain-containing protein [Neoroseomonas oryzicola]NKE18603.1 NUDIX domain-containing protein [Neoroseomonas oryzicola]